MVAARVRILTRKADWPSAHARALIRSQPEWASEGDAQSPFLDYLSGGAGGCISTMIQAFRITVGVCSVRAVMEVSIVMGD